MIMFFIAIMFFIILCLILIWYISVYNKFQILIIKINEAEANIDTTLRKRFDLLNKSVNIIKNNINTEENILEIISKLRSKKLSNFDLDRQLYEAINEFNSYLDKYENLNTCDELIKIKESLKESEYEISALRNYYNDIITEYNKLIKKIPNNIVASLSKKKEKRYFDGKNMNDDITNDFKL